MKSCHDRHLMGSVGGNGLMGMAIVSIPDPHVLGMGQPHNYGTSLYDKGSSPMD
jgi:hypothetical protein